MKIKWYRRSGQRVSEAIVLKAKKAYAESKRTGKMGFMKCSIQPKVADAIDNMTLIEFANHTEMYSYRTKGD